VILVVDDEPSITSTLAMILEQARYTALTAGTGRAAIELLSDVACDLALVDMHLPDMDGITVAREICKRVPNCMILLVSGSLEASDLLQAATRDGLEFDVLYKPIPPGELLGRLSRS
jgi:DNA-binding response OmpR family regulator